MRTSRSVENSRIFTAGSNAAPAPSGGGILQTILDPYASSKVSVPSKSYGHPGEGGKYENGVILPVARQNGVCEAPLIWAGLG